MLGQNVKKIVSMALVCFMACSSMVFATGSNEGEHWAADSISSWVNKGYVKGYTDGSFRPENDITRAEFIAIVNRAFGFKEESEITYKDVTASHWAYNEFKKASAAGYIVGFEDGTFRPNNKISRQEVAAIITRLLNLKEAKESKEFLALKDLEQIPQWSAGAISAIVNKGYMRLRNNDSFGPATPATRAEVIAALDSGYLNFVKAKYNEAGIYTAGIVDGSVEINAKDIVLKDTKVHGNLIIGEGVGDGNITLNNVSVQGDTVVKGGGMNSIIIEDSQITNLIIEKKDGKIRILAKGTTYVTKVEMNSSGKLESGDKDGSNFGYLVIAENIASKEPVILKGNFENVDIKSGTNGIKIESGTIKNLVIATTAKDAKIDLAEGVTVDRVEVNAKIKVEGKGKVGTAEINAKDVDFKVETGKQTGSEKANDTTQAPSGGGGGGGGESSGGPVTPAVSNQTISFEAPEYVGSLASPWTTKGGVVNIVSENPSSGRHSLRLGDNTHAILPMNIDKTMETAEISVKLNPSAYNPGSYDAGYLSFGSIGVLQTSKANWAGLVNFQLQKPYTQTFKPEHRTITLGSPNPETRGGYGKVIGYWEPTGYHTITMRWDWKLDKFTITVNLPSGKVVTYEESLYGTTSMSHIYLYGANSTRDKTHYAWYDDLKFPVAAQTYTVAPTVAIADAGTVKDNTKAGPYTNGTKVNVTASPNPGYEFVNWTVNGLEVSKNASFDYIIAAANTNLVANFEKIAKVDQAAPVGLRGVAPTSGANDDGKITGTTTAMEYKLSSVNDWMPATGTEITGLIPGTYIVRYSAKAGYNAGSSTDVIVGIYDSTAQDNADIAAAKGVIEEASYTAIQAEAGNPETALAKAQALVDALAIEGPTLVVVAGDFTPAIAGTTQAPDGTDGSYTFTVTIDKGKGTQVTSAEKTMTIIATALKADPSFTPGEGGTITFTPFVGEENKIGGLYIEKNHNYYSIIFDGSPIYRHYVELKFLPPSHFGARSYKLQHSGDLGSTWIDYKDSVGEFVIAEEGQDNMSVGNEFTTTMYRLVVNGGPRDGYTSNAVTAGELPIKTKFSAWSLDEGMHISGIMYPWSGRGLKASFTAVHQNYPEENTTYIDEYMNYQWYRVNPVSYEMSAIPGATNLTYITTDDDMGYNLLIRANGDGEHISGFMQIMTKGVVGQNNAYVDEITATGFTLNLHKSIPGLGASDLTLTDYNGNSVTISDVTQGEYAAIYNVSASLDPASGPFYLENNSEFWKITTAQGQGHVTPGVGILYGEAARQVTLEVPKEAISPYHVDVIVLDAATSEPIAGLVKEDFVIRFGESAYYPIDMIGQGGMDGAGGHYTLFPNENMIECPILGSVRIPVGKYTLEFSKTGYQDASIPFEVSINSEEDLTPVDIEVIIEAEEEIWISIFKTAEVEERVYITELTQEDFSLSNASGDVGFRFEDPELRDPDIPNKEKLISPLAAEVFSGTYTLTFAKDGYESVSKQIIIPEKVVMIPVNLMELGGLADRILISLVKIVDEEASLIDSLVVEDFILIRDFGDADSTVIDGFRLDKDPLGGSFEYDILPSDGETFATGKYRLGFSKEGYNTAHIDFIIE